MTVIGYSTLEVIPSFKGLRQQLDKQTNGEMASAGKRGGKKFGDAAGGEAAAGFKDKFSGAMRGFAPLAGLAAGAGLVAGLKDVVGAASNAEQSVGGVRAVFKEYADGVIADSKKADQALGLSATSYQELITLSGALLKNKGIEEFAAQAESLVKVGADLAATFGGSTKEAVDALNAAMRGESDPIERYAISLNETAINAELAAKGQSKLKGAALDQAKAQARLTLIVKQSADAQGAFGREADTAAGKGARATAQLADMRQEVGEKLLPTYAAFVGFLNDQGLPALTAAGGAAQDAGRAFGSLPAPVKAAAGAFVALKIASSVGLTGALSSGVERTGTAMEALRTRVVATGTAYGQARRAAITLTGANAGVTMGAGRLTAAMAGVRAGAIGAGTAMRGFGRSATAALGGPWGLALIAGSAALTYFMSKQEEATQKIDGLTASLNQQTGAITDNTREIVKQALEERGLLKEADRLGLSLSTVTDAALGNADALAQVQAAAAGAAGETERLASGPGLPGGSDTGRRAANLHGLAYELGLIADEAGGAVEAGKRLAAANGDASGSFKTYASRIGEARTAMRELIDAEKERALRNIQTRRDQLALRATLRAAREEAAEGKRVLLDGSKAADENMSSLLDLANQWSTSKAKVQNARGAYEDMRKKFVEVAISMGASKEQANKLATELLKVPKTAAWKYQSEGWKERMREIQALKAELAALRASFRIVYTAQAANQQAEMDDRTGRTPTAPRLIAPAAPRTPTTTTTAPRLATADTVPMFDFRGSTIEAHDYADFTTQTQQRAVKSSLDRVRR